MAVSRKAGARVFIVDDHEVTREGLAELIRRDRGFEIAGTAAGAEEALRLLAQARPQVAVVDLSLAGTGGLTLIKDIRARFPAMKILVLSMHDETEYAERCLRSGAHGYLMKSATIQQVRDAVRGVLAGRIELSPAMSDLLLKRYAAGPGPAGPLSGLTDRELEVFDLIGRGLGTGEIARRTHLSVKTIESHRASIRRKLNLRDSAHLAQRAAVSLGGVRNP